MADPYRGARYFANMTVVIEMPGPLVPGAGARNRVNAMQKRAAGAALVRAARKHHAERIPIHFNRSQQKKYRYTKRARSTMRRKARRGIGNWDLVDSSAMKTDITRKRSDNVRRVHTTTGSTAVLRMNFPGSMVPNRRGSKGITMKVMSDEITKTTRQEDEQIAQDVAEFYLDEMDKEFIKRKRRTFRVMTGTGFSAR